MKELFDIDLANLKKIAEMFQSNDEIGGPSRDWTGIYDECATILYQEIDYLNEGRNADRFRRDFRTYGWVQVPKVYWGYASKKVLTLEYLPGEDSEVLISFILFSFLFFSSTFFSKLSCLVEQKRCRRKLSMLS